MTPVLWPGLRKSVFRIVAVLMLAVPINTLAAGGSSLYQLAIPLKDDRGRSVTLKEWSGRSAVVTMEYSNCRFICSITLQRLKDVQAAADRANRRFEFIILSIDPKNDTPEAWTRYRKTRELHRENWHFLTASVKDTDALVRWLGVRYWLYDEHIMHDFRLLRLDEAGHVVKIMDTFDADPDAFVR